MLNMTNFFDFFFLSIHSFLIKVYYYYYQHYVILPVSVHTLSGTLIIIFQSWFCFSHQREVFCVISTVSFLCGTCFFYLQFALNFFLLHHNCMASFTCSDVDQLFLLIYISIVNAWKGYHILRNLFTFEEIWVILAVFAVLFLFIIYLLFVLLL